MAVPTLTVSPTSLTLKPGESATVTLTGADADNRTVTLVGRVTDSTGTVGVDVNVVVNITDPLTYTLVSPDANLTVAPVAGSDNKFTVTAK